MCLPSLPRQSRRAQHCCTSALTLKNYQNDGDSVYRLFYDTVKGGAICSEANHRLPK